MKIDPSIFKAYDIRGTYPDQLNEEVFYAVGGAFATFLKPKSEVLVGRDVRVYSEKLQKAIIEGLIDFGVDVVDVGLVTTDMYYFGVGHYMFSGGIQVTASHNPPEWHGAKMVRENVIPIALKTGIGQIRDIVLQRQITKAAHRGKLRKLNIENDYIDYISSWINPKKIKPMKIVFNPNFGYAGEIFKKIVKTLKLPLELIPLNDTLDGTFPKGRPDPFVPENRPEFINLVRNTEADFGVAWDADADRCFFCADGGLFTEPYYLNTILIEKMLKKYKGGKIIYDPRYTWALIEAIEKNGGIPILSRVGHSYIKDMMRKENAVFATESSGHTYYRDFWYADSGMIPVMQILEILSESSKKLSELVLPVMNKYFISGEINSDVKDKEAKIKEIAQKYSDAKQSTLDGISIEYQDYRFTVRPSNTEPLLRLTLEARSKELMEEKKREVLTLIHS